MGQKIPGAVGEEVAKVYLRLDIADLSAEASYYTPVPCFGKVTAIRSCIDGVVSTADVTLTNYVNGSAMRGGVVTIATAASAAGDLDVATPDGTNQVEIGDYIKTIVTGGGAGGSPRGHVVFEITRI